MNKILKAQLSLLSIIGPLYFKVNDLNEQEKLQLQKQKKFSIFSIICFCIFSILFYLSTIFINVPLLFFLTSLALPAFTIFFVTIIIIGYFEIKKHGKFIFPFVG